MFPTIIMFLGGRHETFFRFGCPSRTVFMGMPIRVCLPFKKLNTSILLFFKRKSVVVYSASSYFVRNGLDQAHEHMFNKPAMMGET